MKNKAKTHSESVNKAAEQGGEPEGEGAGSGLREAQKSLTELLKASDQTIAHALSGDSQAFLKATKQQNGQ